MQLTTTSALTIENKPLYLIHERSLIRERAAKQ